ncbi:MAG: adenylate/guanylate cyclase domain-containing protein [Scytolyngbya sp. HA4215-MV1]|nr:adenylate/guanylate cyclase domain-containing protein [Scytolyngbya sp. HA4215-MV1]
MFITAPSVAGMVIGLRLAGWLQPLEFAALDQFFLLRPPDSIDARIVIVEIREPDLQTLGQWPMSDHQLAQLLTLIKQQQPRVIGLDLYRDLPVEPGHQELVNALQSIPNLIGIQKVIVNADGAAVKPPQPLTKLVQLSANDLIIDADGKVRRSLLAIDEKGEIIPTLGNALALSYLQAQNIDATTSDTDQVQIGKARFTSLQENDGPYVRADTGGYQILANFRNLPRRFDQVSLTQVLTRQVPNDLFRDRIVLIGITAESVGDFFLTPYSAGWGGQLTNRTSGVELHAEVTSQILSAVLEGRPLIQFWSEPLEYLWIAAWALIGAMVSWGLRYRDSASQRLPLTAISISGLGVGLVGGSYLAFLQSWWVPVVPAVLALVGAAIAVTSYVARSTLEIRETFSRYLTDEVVANLLETSQGLKLGGEKRKVTILMADLRGFSAISERISPEQTVAFINRYLEIMTEAITQYGGTINEFLGDGIFVLFGAPVQQADDAQRAIACAIAMQQAMQQVNEQTLAMNLPLLEMGIGVHTGEVLAGNIGSRKRAKYTVIGSHVNLASRIESYTVGGQVLVSKAVLAETGVTVRIDEQFQVQPKGIQEPLTLYEIGGIGGEFNLFLPRDDEAMIALPWQLSIEYTVLEEKRSGSQVFQGSIRKLSTNQAEVCAAVPVERLTNLKIRLLANSPKSRGMRDVYAKVTDPFNPNTGCFTVRFTAVPPEVATLFDYLQQMAEMGEIGRRRDAETGRQEEKREQGDFGESDRSIG